MRSSRDPAVLLAAIRATGALPMTDITQAELDTMRRRTKSAGRALLRCAPAAGTADLRRSGVVTLGWSPHTTPSPEDSNAYPVRRLAPTTRLTWACCLGLAWPDRTADPFPGEPFTTSLVVDVAAELGLAASWVNSALKHELIPALLVEVSQGTTLRLGPAAAAIPPAFVDSIRRFHHQLPRPDGPPASASPPSEMDDPEPQLFTPPAVSPEEHWEW